MLTGLSHARRPTCWARALAWLVCPSPNLPTPITRTGAFIAWHTMRQNFMHFQRQQMAPCCLTPRGLRGPAPQTPRPKPMRRQQPQPHHSPCRGSDRCVGCDSRPAMAAPVSITMLKPRKRVWTKSSSQVLPMRATLPCTGARSCAPSLGPRYHSPGRAHIRLRRCHRMRSSP